LQITPWFVLEIFPGLFFGQKSLEIMFDDRLVRKQALLDYKKADFTIGYVGFFSKGLTHDFCLKLDITLWLIFGENKLRNNV